LLTVYPSICYVIFVQGQVVKKLELGQYNVTTVASIMRNQSITLEVPPPTIHWIY